MITFVGSIYISTRRSLNLFATLHGILVSCITSLGECSSVAISVSNPVECAIMTAVTLCHTVPVTLTLLCQVANYEIFIVRSL